MEIKHFGFVILPSSSVIRIMSDIIFFIHLIGIISNIAVIILVIGIIFNITIAVTIPII